MDFILDADESLSKNDHQKIKNLLETTTQVGFSLVHRNYTNDSNAVGWISSKNDSYFESEVASGWYQEPIIRLFKNDKSVCFLGVVHETVYDSLIKLGEISKLDIPIHHYGKLDSKKLKEKYLFYEKLGEKKLSSNEADFYSFFELGRQYLHNGKLNLSIDAFEKSISLKRDYFKSWFMLGSAYLLLDKLDLALSKLRKAQSLNQDFPPIYANIGIIFAKKKEFDKAVKNFQKTLQLNPHNASAYKNLGTCYDEMGEKNKAYYSFKKALELNPEYKNSINLH